LKNPVDRFSTRRTINVPTPSFPYSQIDIPVATGRWKAKEIQLTIWLKATSNSKVKTHKALADLDYTRIHPKLIFVLDRIMYIYHGIMNYGSYVMGNYFFLVVEPQFKVGSRVRVFWQWTVNEQGEEYVNQVTNGLINKEETADFLNGRSRFGILYDSGFPFDLDVSPGNGDTAVTMYKQEVVGQGLQEVASFNVSHNFSGRTAADDYDPTIGLPQIR
jgi:hypothetical protein